MEEYFGEVANLVALMVEAVAIAALAYGAARAVVGSVIVALRTGNVEEQRVVFVHFAAWIIIALEFALAADVIRSMIAPTWDDIGKLAAIAAIRTFLNFFLERDIRELGMKRESE